MHIGLDKFPELIQFMHIADVAPQPQSIAIGYGVNINIYKVLLI